MLPVTTDCELMTVKWPWNVLSFLMCILLLLVLLFLAVVVY